MRAAGDRIEQHTTDVALEISQALVTARTVSPALEPAMTSACHILPELLARSHDPLISLLAVCVGDLHWRQAGFGRLPAQAAQKLAVAEMIGPDALVPMPGIRIGLLIQDAGFHYPKHRHAAQELYLILNGTARWAVDDETPTPRPPGSFVYHKSLQPHTIMTDTEPMLALWGWVGDVDGASYSI